MLAEMLAKKSDIKIATTKSGGLYHEKVGVIIDSEDDYVAFSGSQNESNTLSQTPMNPLMSIPRDDAKRAKNKSLRSPLERRKNRPSLRLTGRHQENYHQTCPNTSEDKP